MGIGLRTSYQFANINGYGSKEDSMKNPSKKSNLSARQVIENIHEGIMITDATGRISTVNPTFCKVTGYTPQEAIGKNPSFLKSGKHPKSFYKRMWEAIHKKGFWQGEICNRRKDGAFYTEWLTISMIKNKEGKAIHLLGVFNDISQKKKAEETIRHMAYYDPLTDLPNRSLFYDRLKHNLAQASRSKNLLAVLFLDLDRVKIINDSLGHAIGDQLLKSVAHRLTQSLREVDTVARMGGDEFMVILPGMERPEDIAIIADKILHSLKPPFKFGKHVLYITASIGISIYPFDGKSPEILSKNADTAMYRAKNLGRNNYQIFTQSMKHEVFEELAMGNNLRHALDEGEFTLHYQPQITLNSGNIIGMEALVRWNHPKFGLIQPNRFIRWAEDSGLIVPLGEWVLKTACQQTRKWQTEGMGHLKLAVNLSARQFKQENLYETVEKILKDSSLDPEWLDLELTESAIMENPQAAIKTSQKLRSMGVNFSIDDFGTGYSSLTYLKQFPLTNLKMEQSFVQDLVVDPSDKAIAKAVIALGHGLNLFVIAEGVETETQRDLLKEYQCDIMQGFLFSKPLPPTAFERLVRNQKPFTEETLFAKT